VIRFAGKGKFYITTAIDYVNDKPHIGHAYEKIAADVLARYHRLKGDETFFLTGTDEHGEKNYKMAQAAGLEPKAFVDRNSKYFASLCKSLDITHDKFIRTTDPEHERIAQDIVKRLHASGDVYLGEYEGWYCVPDESYWTDLQLADGKCPECKRPVQKLREKSYFFRLSKYQGKILELFEKNPGLVSPPAKLNEVRNRVKEGLKDLCITRSAFPWGVKFPLDPKYSVYVWVEALSNYVTALGYPDGALFKKYWPADVQLIGKDITWFHTVIWPAMLLSIGAEPPRKVFSHGFLTVDGEKMSKSRGNVVDPVAIVGKYGPDSLRYYLVSEIAFGEDGDFSEKRLVEKHNNELADVLGNFVHRTLTFVNSQFGGKIPEPGVLAAADKDFIEKIEHAVDDVATELELLRLKDAIDKAMLLCHAGNQYLNANEPWKDKARAPAVIFLCANLCRTIAILSAPFTPRAAESLWKQLGLQGSVHSQRWADAKQLALKGHKIGKPEPLFRKIEAPLTSETPIKGVGKPMVKYEDFEKMDIRVARVKNAERVAGADKLLKLTLDAGELGERVVAAGIAEWYKPEDLIGRKIVYLANLEPRTLRGVTSQGMVLAADVEGRAILLQPDKDLAPGAKVR
jgi:methionyl-tRNA synthetase